MRRLHFAWAADSGEEIDEEEAQRSPTECSARAGELRLRVGGWIVRFVCGRLGGQIFRFALTDLFIGKADAERL
jgi:hypothetical protein